MFKLRRERIMEGTDGYGGPNYKGVPIVTKDNEVSESPSVKDYKAEISYATKYGMVKGLLDGLMMQAMDMGDYYSIDAEVFEKVVKVLEEFDKEDSL